MATGKIDLILRVKVYRWCGEGEGLPGMPHELTRWDAKDLGVEAELDAALAAGVYQAVTDESAAKGE
jgi:hypothetical protein